MNFIPEIKKENLLSFASPYAWFAILTIISLVVISFGQNNRDVFFLLWSFTRKSTLLDNLMILSASYLFIVVVLISFVWYIITQKESYIKTGIAFVAVGVTAYIISKIGTHLVIDVRPYIEYKLVALIHPPVDNGFPSDHTLIVMAFSVVVSLFSKKVGWILLVLAIIVALGRIYVGAHHPLDVIGSMFIVLIASLIYLATIFILKRDSKVKPV